MTDSHDASPEDSAQTVQEQLEIAVRDLWSMVEDSGDSYIVFMDRRRLHVRVQQEPDGLFSVQWEDEQGAWLPHSEHFASPRQAAFHAYQGPH